MIVRAGKVKLQAFIPAVRQPAQPAQGSEAQGQISLGGRKLGGGGEVRGKYRIRRGRNLGGRGDMGAGKLECRRLRKLGCGHANLHQDPGAVTKIYFLRVLVHVCARCEHILNII